ncbi:MAG: hypothetical protein EA392_01130 [Cryomorphaceae bacterium]|nr:MAG: hypothetical protein EA392_01130 [Cryomorphaceae bacterium]
MLALGASSVMAQGLSTRENEAIVAKLGARPVAGDAALNFVIPLVGLNANDGTQAGLFDGNMLGSGDLLTFKYYHTDNFVLRAGVRLYANNDRLSGDTFESEPFGVTLGEGDISNLAVINQDRSYVLAIGFEHHFSNSNIFDVYTGADLLVGFNKMRNTMEMEYNNIDGNLNDIITRDLFTEQTNSTVIGLGWVVGWNTFIAQLPISVGIEYGLSMKWLLGGRTKVTEERDVRNADNLNSYSVEYFTDDSQPGLLFSDLSRRNFNMDTNQNVRLTFQFYFTR